MASSLSKVYSDCSLMVTTHLYEILNFYCLTLFSDTICLNNMASIPGEGEVPVHAIESGCIAPVVFNLTLYRGELSASRSGCFSSGAH